MLMVFRNVGIGMSSAAARAGAMLAPFSRNLVNNKTIFFFFFLFRSPKGNGIRFHEMEGNSVITNFRKGIYPTSKEILTLCSKLFSFTVDPFSKGVRVQKRKQSQRVTIVVTTIQKLLNLPSLTISHILC